MFKCRKNVLFRSLYTSMYASQLWWNFRKSMQAGIACGLQFWVQGSIQPAVVSECYWSSWFNVISYLRHLFEKKCVHTVFLERCRKSNNLWLHALMQSDVTVFVLGRYSVCLRVCACHNTFALYLALTKVGPCVLLRMWCCTKCNRLATIVLKCL